MKKLAGATTVFFLLCIVPLTASAQVKGVYWTRSGTAVPFALNALVPSLPPEKSREVTVPFNMWVIDHPKGLVVFDTGNNVAISDGNCAKHWTKGNCDMLKPSQTRDDVIDRQLQRLGFAPDKGKAAITSHAQRD